MYLFRENGYVTCSYNVAEMMEAGSLTVEYPTDYWKIWVRFPSCSYDSFDLVFRAKSSMSSGYMHFDYTNIILWTSKMIIDRSL